MILLHKKRKFNNKNCKVIIDYKCKEKNFLKTKSYGSYRTMNSYSQLSELLASNINF